MSLESLLPMGRDYINEFIMYGNKKGNITISEKKDEILDFPLSKDYEDKEIVKLSIEYAVISYSKKEIHSKDLIDEIIGEHEDFKSELNEGLDFIIDSFLEEDSSKGIYSIFPRKIKVKIHDFLSELKGKFRRKKEINDDDENKEEIYKNRKEVVRHHEYIGRLKDCKKILNYGLNFIKNPEYRDEDSEFNEKLDKLAELNMDISSTYDEIIERYYQRISELSPRR
ncbi:hypothetical protein KY334_01250 [Candidatus Woesearchaeota archaeon]|nr:hypothetical protein [Candidatus Woesearchaeota archaeon]